jgi:transposase
MPRKRHKPEEIVVKLRQVDVLVSQGQSMGDAIRDIGVSEVTFYRWRHDRCRRHDARGLEVSIGGPS